MRNRNTTPSPAYTFALLIALSAGCSRSQNTEGSASGGSPSEEEPCANWISGAEAHSIVESGGLLLDVRTPAEFAEGHIEGAKNIEVDELNSRMVEIPLEQAVVVYCMSGRRAHLAADKLKERGYSVSEIGTQSQYSKTADAGCPK